jgi:starch phosphorylase
MDTDVAENDPWNRDLVARLYGGDNQVRLRQEIVLGLGGMQVLHAMGYEPNIIHLNEGHAAFASLQLIRDYKSKGLSFEAAVEAARQRIVFTTHTPVKAGHDEFPHHLMNEHFGKFWGESSLSREEVLELGTPPGGNCFSMTVLALRTSRVANGVSRKHGEVSRNMWQFLYPDRPAEEVPIISITNGVHQPTWLSRWMVDLFRKYLGDNWHKQSDDPAIWEKIFDIPDSELWDTHQYLKTRLFRLIRERARRRWKLNEVSPGQVVAMGSLLNPEALTIGFARRFATYKRATLIFRDIERIKRILQNPWRPVQLIFSGKAHPADEPGKFFLREVYKICASPEFGGHVAFLEDYDKQAAHYLVQGVDVWLNNPIPPKEASGTSGQKSSLNGVPNLSVLDGWWHEGYNGSNGWAIEGQNDDETVQSIYHLLENEIVPRFYERDSEGIPRRWVATMKEAIRSTAAPFSTARMMKEYVRKVYFAEE